MPYTLAVTSCARHDLLERTLVSFYTTCDELPHETIIFEDGGTPAPAWLPKGIKWLQGGERRGQVRAVDGLYEEVKTDEIFHCEDDWLFRPSAKSARYIERSREILDRWRSVIMVSLRGDSGWHPLELRPGYDALRIARPDWDGWGGFAFNPGLRRRADWKCIGSYGQHVTHGLRAEHERQLSMLYHRMGYVIADLGENLIWHQGDGRSKLDEFANSSSSRDLPEGNARRASDSD